MLNAEGVLAAELSVAKYWLAPITLLKFRVTVEEVVLSAPLLIRMELAVGETLSKMMLSVRKLEMFWEPSLSHR